MPYAGSIPDQLLGLRANEPLDRFAGDGVTDTFTLSYAPASANAVSVIVDGVQQTTSYTILNNTIVFDTAPPAPQSGETYNIFIYHKAIVLDNSVTPDGSVNAAKISLGSAWNSGNLFQLGTFYFWMDATNALRVKNGVPAGDLDGSLV